MKKMDLFKIGMFVGMGAAVGKYLGECISAVFDGSCLGIVKGLAAAGNKSMQKACDAAGVDYEKLEEHTPENVHVQPLQSNLYDINKKKGEE